MPRIASWAPREVNILPKHKGIYVFCVLAFSLLEPSSVSRGASWVLLGSLGSLLEASWAPLGASWGPLGALLGRSWEPSGRSWSHVGGDLSKKGGSLISAAPLECLESPLGPPKRPKSFQDLGKSMFCAFSPFRSWSRLGQSWTLQSVATRPVQVSGEG